MLLFPQCLWHCLIVIAAFFVTTQLWSFFLLPLDDNSVPSSHHSIRPHRMIPMDRPTSADQTPLNVLNQYRDEHGAHVLRKELELSTTERPFRDRKFLVVYYSCPHAAGNLLHDFYNQLLTGMALNRTVLLKYNDAETCSYNQMKHTKGVRCRKANTQDDCERSLHRKAEWLPMYDDWIHHIDPEHDGGSLPYRDSNACSLDDWKHKPIVALRSAQYYIPQPTGSVWNDPIFRPQNSPTAHTILKQLYSRGPDLLYGTLFHELLEFPSEIAPPELQTNPHNNNGVKSFVLHSRHFFNEDMGSSIQNEIGCLSKILPRSYHSENFTKCIIYLLSDRETTIHLVIDHLRQNFPHCTPVVATHGGIYDAETTDAGHYTEHGKWAGLGFMQDLMLGSQAKDGVIGHCYRSSSQLLRELVQFNRQHQKQFENDVDADLPELPTCCLPSVYAHGQIQHLQENSQMKFHVLNLL